MPSPVHTMAPVDTSLAAAANERPVGQAQTPTTPRPGAAVQHQTQEAHIVEPSSSTPTRHSFGGIPGQRPLPDEPLMPAQATDRLMEDVDGAKPDEKQEAASKSQLESEDVEMAEGEDEEAAEDDASDNESVTSESQRPTKKKKGQRFFCTDYPPCTLSFTRSEHLARHIRKHTGERPFQCHCSRRFSRLDNLRQHAQTVHVNEEIPGDSLAATSTRFQRQIRTDRVRPPGSRSRASTIGSQGGPSRGHSRNLSASSVGSTTSSVAEDVRRRPQPLAMAGDGASRARLSLETYNGTPNNPPAQYGYYNHSPTGYSTPTSTPFSMGNASPHYHANMMSPSSTISRSSYYNGARSHGRRQSVPTSPTPYQQQASAYPPTYYNSPGSSAAFSPSSSMYASPTSSVFSHGRRESETEMEYRRRTWHASTNSQYTSRPATSGLTYHQTPDQARPATSQQPAASQMTRLPGIESFDHAPPPAVRQQPSPMIVDDPPRPTSSGRVSDAAGLHQGLTRLDITTANAPSAEHQWQVTHPTGFVYSQAQPAPTHFIPPQHLSMPEQPVTPRKNKRNAWYGGPVPVTPSNVTFAPPGAQRPSPEDSGSSEGVHTPSAAPTAEYHPIMVNPSGSEAHAANEVYVGADQNKPAPARADSGIQSYPADSRPPHTYAMQTGHDPRFAQSNHGKPSDNTGLNVLVDAALASDEGGRAIQH